MTSFGHAVGLTPSASSPRTRDPVVILADTSAWVEFDSATDSRVDERLALLIGSDGLCR